MVVPEGPFRSRDIPKDPKKVNGAIQAMLSDGLIRTVEKRFDGHSRYSIFEATPKLQNAKKRMTKSESVKK